jgi:hypothetical protein
VTAAGGNAANHANTNERWGLISQKNGAAAKSSIKQSARAGTVHSLVWFVFLKKPMSRH